MTGDVPLQEHLELRLEALEQVVVARFTAGDRALELSSIALRERLEHSNGLIEQMREQRGIFAQRIELVALERRVELLEEALSGLRGVHKGLQPLFAIGMAVLAAVLGFIASKIG